MANWTILKAAIANVVKTNGNQEITGQLLQNVLNNIVTSVGEHATFAGIANPATNPGTPDGPVFYLASEAGTYANFGSLELKGLSVIIYNGNKWAAVSLNAGSKDDYINILNIISANNTALKYDVENVQLYPILSTDGIYNSTKDIIETQGTFFKNYRVLYYDVSSFDYLTVIGTVTGSVSTSSDKRPSISIVYGGKLLYSVSVSNSDIETTIDLSKVSDKKGMVAIVNGIKAKDVIVKGKSLGFITRLEDVGLLPMKIIKGYNEIIKEDKIEAGRWNYTNDILQNSTTAVTGSDVYYFDNIAIYDKLIIRGAQNGTSLSSSTAIVPSLSLYDGDTKVDYKQIPTTDDTEIDLSKYREHLNLRAIVLCSKQNTITLRAIASGINNSIKDMQEEISGNTKDIRDVTVKIDGINENIFPEVFANLRNGWWNINTEYPNGHLVNYSSVQRTKCTDKIDITSYDSVVLKGLFNGIALSNQTSQYEACAIYGDGKYIGRIRNITTEASNIFLSDYSQYSKIEIVLNIKLNNSLNGPEYDDNTIQVIASGIDKGAKAKRLVICGDSLVGNRSGLLVKEFNSILSAQGYDAIIYRSMGGENIIGNLTRAGGLGIRVKAPFTIPASGSVECALESQWILASGGYAPNPYNSLPNGGTKVTICGILGALEKASTNAVGVAFYTSERAFISSLSNNGTYSIPSKAAYYRFTINNPQTGEAHITINSSAVNIADEATLNGYINSSGTYVSSDSYKCSDYISISQGTIYIDSLATSTGYKFTRDEAGESVKVGLGEVLFDNALYDDRDYPHIWFTGQNGGYADEQEWAQMIKAATYNFSEKYIVCSTALTRTTDKLIKEANIHFGGKYLNLRAYTQGQAIYDGQRMGLIDSQYNAEDYETLFWPGSDKIHQNNLLSYIWAVKMWNMLLDFGFVEGTRIDNGDYYVP